MPKNTLSDSALHPSSIGSGRVYLKFIVTWYWTIDAIARNRIPCSAG